MDNDPLPIESESQEIGHHAVMAFHSLRPLSWRITPTDGDSDVGLDLQIQLVEAKRYQGIFHAQVKGSRQKNENGRSETLSADQSFYSVELKISTLNYYVRVGNPVMLVFVDLSIDAEPRHCKAFYLWINDEIDSLLDGKPNLTHLGADTHTFRIPTENVLDANVDVFPYLLGRVKKQKSLEVLFELVKDKKQDPVETIGQLNRRISTTPIALDTVLNVTDNPWLDAPKDSFASSLLSISNNLKLYNAELTAPAIAKLELRLKEATSHERSEFFYLKGRLLTLTGPSDQALQFYERAMNSSPELTKYRLYRIA
jgi:hypothetical protein